MVSAADHRPGGFRPLDLCAEGSGLRQQGGALKLQRQVLADKAQKSLQDMVTLNLGVAIYLLEDNLPLELAMEMAQAKVERGLSHGVCHA